MYDGIGRNYKAEKQGRMAEMSSSLVESSPTGGHSQGRLTADQMKLRRFIQIGFHLKSSQLFYREIFDRLWYITITERKKHEQQRFVQGGDAGSTPAEVSI